MKKKILGILVMTLLIVATLLPVAGTMNIGGTQVVGTNTASGENEVLGSRTSQAYGGSMGDDDDWRPPSYAGFIHHGGKVAIGTNVQKNRKLYVTSDFSKPGATVFIENTHEQGIGMIVETTSDDLPLVVSQKGTGAIFRCDSWTPEWRPVFKVANDGTTTCSILEIKGGSDIAEPFIIKEKDEIKPGMIVVIDPENPGALKVSDKSYDRCVAGIVSGAGGIKPGLMITQEDTFDGTHHVALAGRVYGLCDASYGCIEPGDLLTTSPTPGYAMKVTDYERAQGAILGKAMTSIKEGNGLVLILVSLQ